MVKNSDIRKARVAANTLNQRQYFFLPTFNLLAETHAVKNQSTSDVLRLIADARFGCNVGYNTDGSGWRDDANVQDFMEFCDGFHRGQQI